MNRKTRLMFFQFAGMLLGGFLLLTEQELKFNINYLLMICFLGGMGLIAIQPD